MPVSTIQLTFEGMLVLFVKDGAPFADAGILKTAPKHDAKLLIAEIPRIGAPKPIFQLEGSKVNKRYELIVKNPDGTRPPKIEIHRKGAFDRKSALNDPTDYRWVLDYEGKEMYDGPIAHKVNEFRSFLRMNAGKFFTQQISENELVLKKPTGSETIGRVAVKIRSEIKLVDDDVAFFSTGSGDPIELRAQAETDYGLYYGLVRPPLEHGTEIDAENYHAALATDKPANKKIHFDRSQILKIATPDAACFPPTSSPPGF